jgi:ATP-dependent DNA helicase RecQ
MTATPGEILRTVFGYPEFRTNQEQVIETLLRGEDVFVLMPTGGGKSLCYQIPAILRPGTGIVVSPLISLMKDQVDALRANGVRAAAYNSSLEAGEAREVLIDLRAGRLDLLYVSPERATSDGFLERLAEPAGGRVALIAVDEAHCISQWGHDFRPEYVELRRLRERLPGVPMVALTATADPHTRDDIRRQLGLERASCFVSSFDRPNIRLEVVDKLNPHAQLQRFLAGYGHAVRPALSGSMGWRAQPGSEGAHEGEAGIIYCSTRKRTDDLAAYLCGRGIAAGAYHAGLSAEERDEVQEAFIFDRIKIVVATVAFGMGIDKTNVRFVVHWDLPQHLEGYYQEIGRAGRDGLPASALMLFGWEDVARVRALIEKGGNEQRVAVERHKLGALVGFARELTCRRRALLGYLGETVKPDGGRPECGNCDVCLDPPELYDATEDARKALSCVYRMGGRFGVGHVVDVLRGSQNQRIVSLGHERLSTYGIGADRSTQAWRSLLRQLVHLGYLRQDMGEYPVLKLTPSAAPLLRGEVELRLARPRVRSTTEVGVAAAEGEAAAARAAQGGRRGAKRRWSETRTGEGLPPRTAAEWEAGGDDGVGRPEDDALFEELRVLRRRIAEREGVPAYVIFHDATLREMAVSRPATLGEFLGVGGVGERKLEKYGEEFLALIRRAVRR